MIVDHLGTADPLGSADRTEFRQGLIEFVCARSPRQEEIELFAAKGHPLADESDPVDRSGGRFGLEGQTQEPKQHAFVLTGAGHADPPTLLATIFELQGWTQFDTAERAKCQAFGESRNESA